MVWLYLKYFVLSVSRGHLFHLYLLLALHGSLSKFGIKLLHH